MLKKWLLGIVSMVPLVPLVLASGGVIRINPAIGPAGLPYVVWALVFSFFFLVAITVLSLRVGGSQKSDAQ